MAEGKATTLSNRISEADWNPRVWVVDNERTRRRRLRITGNLSDAIEQAGKERAGVPADSGLHSHRYKPAFFHRLHQDTWNYVDIYVVLNGARLKHGRHLLRNHVADDDPKSNPFSKDFADDTHELRDPETISEWLKAQLKKAVECEAKDKVQLLNGQYALENDPDSLRRGVQLLKYGQQGPSNFDFIPTFLTQNDNGDDCLVIPEGSTWKVERCHKGIELWDTHSEGNGDSQARELLIRVMKYFKAKFCWERRYGITSFIIRLAIDEVLTQTKETRLYQQVVRSTMEQLNKWIEIGCVSDPYTWRFLILKKWEEIEEGPKKDRYKKKGGPTGIPVLTDEELDEHCGGPGKKSSRSRKRR